MGLDSVELVITFEETFGVEIKDEEAEKCITPRMVGDLIFSKLKDKDEAKCMSQCAFYMLRRFFCKMFDLDKKSIVPDMNFRHLIPTDQERERWEQIGSAIAARRWPELERPLWMSRFIGVVGLTILVVSIYVTTRGIWNIREAGLEGIIDAIFVGISIGLILGMVLASLFWAIAYRLTDQFEIYIPARFQSIRDIIPHAIASERITWTRQGISIAVKEIVLEQMGLSESDYTEYSRFHEDLGLD